MKTNIRAAVTVFAVAISSFSHAQLKKATFHGGFIYPVSSHGLDAANYSNAFSVHALAVFRVKNAVLLVRESP